MKKLILTILVCLVFTFTAKSQDSDKTDTSTAQTTVQTKPGSRRPIFRATKEQIIQVQTRLTENGSYEGAADGKFNQDFRDAIREFQGANGLKKTGTLNRATLEKMEVELTEKQQAMPVNPNSFANSNDGEPKVRKKTFRPTKTQITETQTKLREINLFNGEITGRYSNEFRDALKSYQEANNLSKTGRADEETLTRLEIELTDRQKGIETENPDKPKRIVFRPTKEQIAAAQVKLKQSELYDGEADGKYNQALRAAIRDFQSANGLKRKGSLNRATLEKMEIVLTEAQLEIPVNPDDFASDGSSPDDKKVRKIFRATKDQIGRVQDMLRETGLYEGESTGKLNPATRSAIREWQGQNNVPKTGTLNKITLEAMNIELTDKQKEF